MFKDKNLKKHRSLNHFLLTRVGVFSRVLSFYVTNCQLLLTFMKARLLSLSFSSNRVTEGKIVIIKSITSSFIMLNTMMENGNSSENYAVNMISGKGSEY